MEAVGVKRLILFAWFILTAILGLAIFLGLADAHRPTPHPSALIAAGDDLGGGASVYMRGLPQHTINLQTGYGLTRLFELTINQTASL